MILKSPQQPYAKNHHHKYAQPLLITLVSRHPELHYKPQPKIVGTIRFRRRMKPSHLSPTTKLFTKRVCALKPIKMAPDLIRGGTRVPKKIKRFRKTIPPYFYNKEEV
jgi:hypothetical protein